jgi:hypothetical protein
MAIDFFATAMGRRFYEHTVPKIADELARLNKNLEALVAELRRLSSPTAGTCAAPGDVGARTPDEA